MSEGWESLAYEWDELQGEYGDVYRRELIHPAVAANLALLGPGRVLDVGSGNGTLSRYLASRGWKVVGIEASSTLVDLAEAYSGPGDVAYLRADARHAVVTGEFDAVVSLFSHQDIGEIDDVYEIASSTLRPGGLVLLVGEELHEVLATTEHSLSSRKWIDHTGARRRQEVTWTGRMSGPAVQTTIFAASEYTDAAARAGFVNVTGPVILRSSSDAVPDSYRAHPRFVLHTASRR